MGLLNRCLLSVLLLSPMASFAADAAAPAEPNPSSPLQKWQAMTPEQRQAARAERQQRFQALTPEQQAALRAKRKARREQLTPEQREAIREKLKGRHAVVQANTPNS